MQSSKSEVQEQRRAFAGREAELAARSQILKRNYVMAFEQGNKQGMAAAMAAINAHDRAIPERALGGGIGQTVVDAETARSISQETGLPIGAHLNDYLFNQKLKNAYNIGR